MGQSPTLLESSQQDAVSGRACSKCGQKVAGTLDCCPHDGGTLLSTEALARVGMRVGQYELKGIIGEGGTGAVYRGRHVASDRQVAIKILHERCSRRKDLVDQFVAHATAASHVHHANLVEVADLGTTPEGNVFVATERLEGESLQDRLHGSASLSPFEAINILRQVAHGLGAAHEAGVVHGGLKPANVFLCRRKGRRRIVRRSKTAGMRLVVEPEDSFDLVKLVDFGMASFLELEANQQDRVGAVYDAAQYVSPEQAQGRSADRRSDIYSLGVLFFQMVTGTPPFGGELVADILSAHISGLAIAPSRRAPNAPIDGHIDALILRCLRKSSVLRFANTGELCEALDACVTDCMFLRDAHRLPGINESEIALSEPMPQARLDLARPPSDATAKKPDAARVSQMFAATSIEAATKAETATLRKGAPSVGAKPPALPAAEKPAGVTAGAKPPMLPVEQQPVPPAMLAGQTARGMAAPPPVPATAKPPSVSVGAKPPPVPAPAKPMRLEVSAQPAVEPASVGASLDPGAGSETTWSDRGDVQDPDAAIADLTESLDDGSLENAVFPARRILAGLRRPRSIALAGVLVAGTVGLGVWAARKGVAPDAAKPVVGSVTAPTPEPAPSPPPPASAAEPLVVAPTLRTSELEPAVVVPPATPALALAPTSAPLALPASRAEPVAAWPALPASKAEDTMQAPAPASVPSGKEAAPAAAPVAPSRPAKPASTVASSPQEPSASDKVRSTGTRPAGELASSRARSSPTDGAEAKVPARGEPPEAAPALDPAIPPRLVVKSEPQPAARALAPKKANPGAEAPASAGVSVGTLVRGAQEAWMRGLHSVALNKAQAALKSGPTPAQAMQAYEIIGVCACVFGEANAARDAMSHLSSDRRNMIMAACAKSGVAL